MKRLSVITLFLAIAMCVFANDPDVTPDTVANIENPVKVIVTDNGSQTSVRVEGTAARPDYRFLYTVTKDDNDTQLPKISIPFTESRVSNHAKGETTMFMGIYMGVVAPYNSPEPFRTSIERGISELIGYRYTPRNSTASFGLGFGFGLLKYIIRRGMTVNVDNDMFYLAPAPESAHKVRSHLSIWRLHVPFYYRQRIHKSFGFKISATLNLNVSAKGKTAYRIGDDKHTIKVKGLHQRLLTPDFTFAIGNFGAFSAYARWSPVSVFKHQYGPELKSLSFGLNIGL